jgi:hypothetical protein
MLESELERQCKTYAESNECLLVKIQGVRGYPDRLLITPWKAVAFLEFKQAGKKARPLQQHILDELNKMGYAAGVVDHFSQFQALLLVLQRQSGSPTNTNPEV